MSEKCETGCFKITISFRPRTVSEAKKAVMIAERIKRFFDELRDELDVHELLTVNEFAVKARKGGLYDENRN